MRLLSSIGPSDTTIDVDTLYQPPSTDGLLLIDAEKFAVTKGFGGQHLTVRRGVAGTSGASHDAGSVVRSVELDPDYDTAPPSGGGSISVTDGTTTVPGVTKIGLPAGLLIDAGGGQADFVLEQPAGPSTSAGARVTLQTDVGGGSAELDAADGSASNSGSSSYVKGGGANDGAGYPGSFQAGGAAADGTGGSTYNEAGDGYSGTNTNGGDVHLDPGNKDGSGRNGLIIVGQAGGVPLPTSDPGVAGALWADATVVKVSAG